MLTQEQIKHVIKYIDICSEIIDAIHHVHLKQEEAFGYKPFENLYVEKEAILVPKWLFEPNTLNELTLMGYVLESDGKYGITQLGYDLACCATFTSLKNYYTLKIHDEEVFNQLLSKI